MASCLAPLPDDEHDRKSQQASHDDVKDPASALAVQEALDGIGTIITSMETVGALMAARTQLP